jgi:hypothetical protein
MSESFPAKLAVPVDDKGNTYEFTIYNSEKVSDF